MVNDRDLKFVVDFCDDFELPFLKALPSYVLESEKSSIHLVEVAIKPVCEDAVAHLDPEV